MHGHERILEMLKLIRSRLIEVLAFTVLAALTGAWVGYQAGRYAVYSLAENRLDQYAASVTEVVDARATEGREVLAMMASSKSLPCSDGDIGAFRQVVLRSEYLKDVGRIHDGVVHCSASAGRSLQSDQRYTPDFFQQDGTVAYRNLVPVEPGKPMMVGLQRGDAYVVFGSQMPVSFGAIPMKFSISLKGAPKSGSGLLTANYPGVEPSVLLADGRRLVGATLSATRCSTRYTACTTAYALVATALRSERNKIIGCLIGGALLGGLLGLALSLAHGHNLGLAQQLRRAVRNDKLQVVYQPVVDLVSGTIVGAEALVRWSDDSGQAISPDVFIAIAEERGFVGEISRLVLRHVLRDFGETLRDDPGFRTNINITAADLADATFIPELEIALSRAGVESRSLGIEITESSTARHQIAKDAICRMRRSGHILYIDDFGTGYSSLAYLNDLSVDAIKIDKAFTQSIGTDSVTVNILPQILAMAEALHLQVVVEGVETQNQADYFAGAPLHIFAQGWLFGRPVPAKDLQRALIDRLAFERAKPAQHAIALSM